MSSPASQPGPRSVLLVALFLVSAAVLGFEVSLTRSFSVLLRYHFVFLVLSTAVCGLGAGGLLDLVLLRRRLGEARPEPTLSVLALIFGLLIPGALLALFRTPLSAHLTSLWVVGAVCFVPFCAAGLFLSHTFAAFSQAGGRLYFADLAGAAVGSLGVVVALQFLGGTNAAFALGCGACLGAVLLAFPSAGVAVRAGTLGGLILTLGLLGTNLGLRLIDLPVVSSSDPTAKVLYRELADETEGAKIVETEWNAFARTDVVAYPYTEELYLYTDGDVPTNIRPFGGDTDELRDLLSFIGYLPFHFREPRSLLSIGPGGGLDVLMGQMAGCGEIVGVELNPSIPPMVRRRRAVAGPVYDYANVELVVGEGRSYVRRCDRRFDLIYAALTFANTTPTANLGFVDSYIHTQEAFDDYLSRLTERGRFVFITQVPGLVLRAVLTARETLAAAGVPRGQAMDHLAVISALPHDYRAGPYRHLMILSRCPIPQDEAEAMGRLAFVLRLAPGFLPGVHEPAPFAQLRDGDLGPDAFCDYLATSIPSRSLPQGFVRNVTPVSDDSPFFTDLSRGIPSPFRRFIVGIMLLGLVAGVAFVVYSRRGSDTSRGVVELTGAAVYFALLGAGFMLVEISLAHKLTFYLGYPVLSLCVVLFALLIGGAVGSLLSQAWTASRLPGRVATVGVGVALACLALWIGLDRLLSATLGWAILPRAAVAMAVLVPIGLVLGMPFPSGLRFVGRWSPAFVPWAWAVNGVFSVAGSVLAMAGGKLWGFSSVLAAAGAAYLAVAGVAFLRARRPEAPGGKCAATETDAVA